MSIGLGGIFLWACVVCALFLCGMCLWACVVCDMSLCDIRLKTCVLYVYKPVWYVPMHVPVWYLPMSFCDMCLWAFVLCAYEPVWYVPLSLCSMLRACVVWAHEHVWYVPMSQCGRSIYILRPGVASLSLCEAVRSSPQSYDVYNCWITTADMKKKHLAGGGGGVGWGTNKEKGRNGESDESFQKMDNLWQKFFWCTYGRTTAGFTSNFCKESNYICPSVLSHKRSPASCGQQRKIKKTELSCTRFWTLCERSCWCTYERIQIRMAKYS